MSDFRGHDFSLRQLQYAVAVEALGGFGKAAEAAGVSQPSLSAQVGRLEAALGVLLFERHARGFYVTDAGRQLLPLMRAALGAADTVRDAAATASDRYAVTLRIGIIPTVAPYLLPRVVETLHNEHPALRIHWLELQTRACEAALTAGDLDAMVIADIPTATAVHTHPIGWEPFEVLVPQTHVLQGEVDVADVPTSELLLLEDGHCLRDHTMTLCMRPGAQESPYRATSLPTLVQMIASGLGISVVPASAMHVESARARVRAVPFKDEDVGRTVRVCWRNGSVHVPLLEVVASALAQALEAALAE